MPLYINTTPHNIVFARSRPIAYGLIKGEMVRLTPEEETETFTLPPSGIVINATPQEEEAGGKWVAAGEFIPFVKVVFRAGKEDEEKLLKLEMKSPCLIIGSIIAAQAFPGRVLGMIAAPGFERVPVGQKRMLDNKFMTFFRED